MSEEKVLTNAEDNENHENDDMIAQHTVKSDETISLSVSDEARPQHTWTKKQKRTVWIAAVVAVVLEDSRSHGFAEWHVASVSVVGSDSEPDFDYCYYVGNYYCCY